ncbi:uncharacterized protein N7506_006205 [Penicillium brevicompactum]|uniref:uncharacterized protein n=1 Tax=Penicillium brevicompactum TaxID=5074 RepID=UPI00254063DD|nr:uncharacterized protein N7506_006205 [Penicillium brevicompactum]KAJ5332422.1 hypothetical protein N7506_006205 [Penicillium brevicompactum]
MPPKAETSTETPLKGRGGIVKRTPSKAAPTKVGTRSSDAVASRDLLFLWRVVKLSGGVTPDKNVLASELGCSTAAAMKRWTRFKAKMEKIEAAAQADDDDEDDDATMQDPNDGDDEKEDTE